MNEHELGLTAFFNDHFAGLANSILGAVQMPSVHPARPWENWLVIELFVVALLMVLAALLRATLSADKPGIIQHTFELVWDFIKDTIDQVGIHHGEQYAPYIATVFILILSLNLIGMIPAFESPTMVPYVPAGMALVTFVYFNVMGFRANGIKYLAQFAGPVRFDHPIANIAIILFMLPIELVSVFIRPLSLTVRLYGNMFAGEQVTNVFLDLTKILVPVVFMALHIFVSLVQAYVFMLLTTIYVSLATSHDH